jgi:hypothetical protein
VAARGEGVKEVAGEGRGGRALAGAPSSPSPAFALEPPRKPPPVAAACRRAERDHHADAPHADPPSGKQRGRRREGARAHHPATGPPTACSYPSLEKSCEWRRGSQPCSSSQVCAGGSGGRGRDGPSEGLEARRGERRARRRRIRSPRPCSVSAAVRKGERMRLREGRLLCSAPRNGRQGRPTAFCSSRCSSC